MRSARQSLDCAGPFRHTVAGFGWSPPSRWVLESVSAHMSFRTVGFPDCSSPSHAFPGVPRRYTGECGLLFATKNVLNQLLNDRHSGIGSSPRTRETRVPDRQRPMRYRFIPDTGSSPRWREHLSQFARPVVAGSSPRLSETVRFLLASSANPARPCSCARVVPRVAGAGDGGSDAYPNGGLHAFSVGRSSLALGGWNRVCSRCLYDRDVRASR